MLVSTQQCKCVQYHGLHTQKWLCLYIVFCVHFFKKKCPLPSPHTLRQVVLKSGPSPAQDCSEFIHSLGSGFGLLTILPPPFLCLFMASCGGLGCPSPFFANLYSVDSSEHSWDWTSA